MVDAAARLPEDEGMTESNAVIDDCRAGRLRAQSAVAGLYQLAALLVGDERQAASLVELAVARTDTDPCADAEASIKAAQVALVEAAVRELRRADPAALDAPALESGTGGCIEGDDVSVSGLASDAQVLRDGLNKLSPVQRVVFVSRAILGWDSVSSAALLGRGWKAAQVSEVFRQALCSVSSSLVRVSS